MKNNYKKSIEIINNSNFTVKGIKTFRGMEGYGVNANLYYKGKKVAFLIDSGDGGCLDINWVKGYRWDDNPLIPFIKTLPKTMWNELDGEDTCDLGEYKWDDESVCNALIETQLKVKDYNKWLRKIVIFNTKTKKINHYKAPKKALNNKCNTPNGVMTGREYLGSVGIILNDLPKEEAYDYFSQYK